MKPFPHIILLIFTSYTQSLSAQEIQNKPPSPIDSLNHLRTLPSPDSLPEVIVLQLEDSLIFGLNSHVSQSLARVKYVTTSVFEAFTLTSAFDSKISGKNDTYAANRTINPDIPKRAKAALFPIVQK